MEVEAETENPVVDKHPLRTLDKILEFLRNNKNPIPESVLLYSCNLNKYMWKRQWAVMQKLEKDNLIEVHDQKVSLTLEGLIFEGYEKREKRKNREVWKYWIPVLISLAAIIISVISLLSEKTPPILKLIVPQETKSRPVQKAAPQK
ncbi:MAG: hypothetical protein ABIQ40_16175 [Bacteroidia bacterium]